MHIWNIPRNDNLNTSSKQTHTVFAHGCFPLLSSLLDMAVRPVDPVNWPGIIFELDHESNLKKKKNNMSIINDILTLT